MGRIPKSSQNQWAQERAEPSAAKTTAQEMSGKIQMTPPLHHRCQKWTQDITAVNLCHSQNRTLDLIAATAARINSLASLTSCSLLIWCPGRAHPIGQQQPCAHSPAAWGQTYLWLWSWGDVTSHLLWHLSPLPSLKETLHLYSHKWQCLGLLTENTLNKPDLHGTLPLEGVLELYNLNSTLRKDKFTFSCPWALVWGNTFPMQMNALFDLTTFLDCTISPFSSQGAESQESEETFSYQ